MFSGAAPEHTAALQRYGDLIGTAFQISDDIIDIASPADESGKTPGTDLREGVKTLPMLYALSPQDPRPAAAPSCSPARSPTTTRWTRR